MSMRIIVILMIMCSTVPPGPALEPMPRIQLEGAGALRLWARDAWLSSESDRRPVGRRAASVLKQQPRFGPLWARADMFTFSFISSAMRCHLTLSQIFWDRIQPETFWLGGRKPWPATLFLIRENLSLFARVCASAREDLTT